MNDQDKVLISAYLDNELTQEENSYVESLIKEDSEAFNYLNQIKEINNQTESFFQEALNSEEFKNTQSFVDGLQSRKKFSFKSILKNFFIPQAIAGYALSGLLFFNLGTNSIAGFQDTNSQFAQAEYEQDIYVFRSGSSDNLLTQIQSIALNLIAEGKYFAKGNLAEETYTLKLIKEAEINEVSSCFIVEFESLNTKRQFSICKSGENSSFLEITQ